MSEAEKAILREYARKIWALISWEEEQLKTPNPALLSTQSRGGIREAGNNLIAAIDDIIAILGESSEEVLGIERQQI